MRWIIPIAVLMTFISGFSSTLFDADAGCFNPIRAAFLSRNIALQFDYLEEGKQAFKISVGISSDFLNAYLITTSYGGFLEKKINVSDVVFRNFAVVDLKVMNLITLGVGVPSEFSMEGGFNLSKDTDIPVVIGLGGKKFEASKVSAGALYYLSKGALRLDSNGSFQYTGDFSKGSIGVYGMNSKLNGSTYLDVGLDLGLINELSSGDILESLINHSYFLFSFTSGILTLGVNWLGDPEESYYNALLGINFDMLRIWIGVYGNPGGEIFGGFTWSVQVSL